MLEKARAQGGEIKGKAETERGNASLQMLFAGRGHGALGAAGWQLSAALFIDRLKQTACTWKKYKPNQTKNTPVYLS